jgi:hypothetical protein
MKPLNIILYVFLAVIAIVTVVMLKPSGSIPENNHKLKYQDTPTENRYFAYSNDSKFSIKRNTNIDKGFNITVKGSENIDRGMLVSPDRIK